jgi:hypothetical protein
MSVCRTVVEHFSARECACDCVTCLTSREACGLCGWMHRYDASGVTKDTRIKFMTDGILLREIQEVCDFNVLCVQAGAMAPHDHGQLHVCGGGGLSQGACLP